MDCPVCQKEPAINHPTLGIMPGQDCKSRRDGLKSPDHPIEFTTDNIKNDRKEYAKDIIQPRRGEEPSKEFIEAYPSKAKAMFTEKQIKKARNVWK